MNDPETTRYNYLLAAAQLARYLGEHSPDPEADDAAADPTEVTRDHIEESRRRRHRRLDARAGLELGMLRIPTDNVALLTECDWELTLPSLSLTSPPRRSWYRSL